MQNRFYYHIIHLYLALVENSDSVWPNCQAAQYQMWVSDVTNLVKDQETIELVMKKFGSFYLNLNLWFDFVTEMSKISVVLLHMA